MDHYGAVVKRRSTSNLRRFEATIAQSDGRLTFFDEALGVEPENLVEITANPQGEDGWATLDTYLLGYWIDPFAVSEFI